MATTLFELEGKVTLNSEGFFGTAETISGQLESLSTAVGNLETKLSGTKISQILDSTTFTAEQVVVTGGLDALSQKVSEFKEALTAVDLGGTLLSAVTGGLAALAGNLLIGDIKIGLDVPSADDVNTAVSPVITQIEGMSAAVGVTLPDAAAEPLATDITTAGTAIADALNAACAWSIPVPNFPDLVAVRNKIKAMWSIVTAGLNLSVNASINVGVYGGGGGNDGSGANQYVAWQNPDKIPANSYAYWYPDSEYAIHFTQDQLDRIESTKPDFEGAIDFLTGDLGELLSPLIPKSKGKSSAESTSPLEDAVYAALTRWAQPVGGDALAVMLTPKVSTGIANGTRGAR